MKNLKEFRMRASMTQAAVAKALGTTQQTYQRWEKGNARPPIEMIMTLAAMFRTTVSALTGLPEAETRY